MGAIVRAMQRPDSNLEVKDRTWLKIKIPNAFIGSDLVEWLYGHVKGKKSLFTQAVNVL